MGALLVVCLALAAGFALATPYGEAPDEYAHFGYVEFLVRNGGLPPIRKWAPTYEAQQPPLYYALNATIVVAGRALTGTSVQRAPLAPPVQPNPQFEPPRRSVRALIHPAAQRWLLWPLALRGFSILLGLGTVGLTYATACALVPRSAGPTVALIAMTFAALLPEANSVRASISNENLADLIGAWIFYLLAVHLVRPYRSRRVVWIGIALGLGLLTKQTAGFWALPALIVLWMRRPTSGGRFWRDLTLLAGAALILAGPYYLYLWTTYGDPLASAAIARMMPANSPWHLTDLYWLRDPFRLSVWTSFWGVYGWQLIFLPDSIYYAFGTLTLIAVAGGAYLLRRRALTPAQHQACAVVLLMMALLYGFVIVYSLRIVAWQGRLLYPALSGICLLFGLGLAGLLLGPAAVRAGVPIPAARRRLANLAVPLLAAGLLAVNIYSLLWLVWPILNPPG